MDNPWAENWTADDQKPQDLPLPTVTSSTWTSPTTLPDNHQREVALPSWSTTDDAAWSVEESTADDTVWGKPSAFNSGWEPAPVEFAVPAGGSAALELHPESPFASETFDAPKPPSPEPSEQLHPSPLPISYDLPPSSPPLRPVVVVGDDTDGFGSFATVNEDGEEPDAWVQADTSLSSPSKLDEDAWGNSWEEAPEASVGREEQTSDEWEVAMQEKEKQDRHVPPERLNAILSEFETVVSELWPEEATKGGEDVHGGPRLEMDNVVSESTRRALVPEDLTLPMSKPFAQTFISKREADALKLSRNDVVTRKGPMSMYMASKGSTSWEAAVKAKVDISQMDFTPAGWKILTKEEQVVDDSKKKATTSGGILSFFSRKATSTSTPDESPRHSRPASPAPKVVGQSPRVSIDVNHLSNQVSAKPSPIDSSQPSPVATSANPKAAESPVVSPSSALDFFPEEPKDAPPQSVVSRFLGRFSRNSRTSSTSRDSLALSSDDLEFLSDVVPTTSITASADDELKSLSIMISSKSPPLPPPMAQPLAPPPRATPQPRAVQQNTGNAATAQTPASKPAAMDDLFSLFDSPPPAAVSIQPTMPISMPTSDGLSLLADGFSFPSTSSISLTSSVGSPSSVVFSNEGSVKSLSLSFNTPPLPPPKPNYPPSAARISSPPSITSSPGPSRSSTPASTQLSFQFTSSSISPLPLPPPSTSRTQSPSPFGIPPPHPPAPVRAHTPSRANTTLPSIQDDDFDDFVTSPVANAQQPTSFSLIAPPNPTNGVAGRNSFMDAFGDFSSFAAAPATPPKTPPKPIPRAPSPLQPISGSPSSRVSRVDHQRTQSLMDTIASRGDKWLSPAAKPAPLPPPEAPAKTDQFDDGIFAPAQTKVSELPKLPPPPVSKSSTPPPMTWKLPPPPPSNRSSPFASAPVKAQGTGGSFSGNFSIPPPPAANRWSSTPATIQPQGTGSSSGSFGIMPPPSTMPLNRTPTPSFTPMVPTATGSSAKDGKEGLSAQDLAFFEGL